MDISNKNSKSESKTRFKDLLKEELESANSNREDVIKNTSSASDLSMIRFLLNKRNQFTR